MRARPTPKGKPAARGRVPAPAMTIAEKAEASRDLIAKMLARGVTRKEAAGRLGLTQQAVCRMFPVAAPVVVSAAPVAPEPVSPPPPPPPPPPVPVPLPWAPAPAPAPAPEGHLIAFDYRNLPAPLTEGEEAARLSPGWRRRLGHVQRVEEMAAGQSGAIQAGLLHLADLHRHHARFYPEHHIPPSDLPTRYTTVPPAGIIGSSGQLCAEG